MKRIVVLTLFLLCLLGCMTAFAQDIELYMFGNKIECDVPPIIEEGRTLVPVRAIAESGLGANVTWDGANQQVIIAKEGMTVVMTIGSPNVYVNGVEFLLDVPARIINDRTMIPIRFVVEAFDFSVEWDNTNRRVIIGNNYITGINVEQTPYDNLLNIGVSQLNPPNIFTLSNPYRIVVDFEGFVYDNGDGSIDVNSAFIKQVRWAIHDGYFRIVVECPSEQPYRYVETGANSISLVVGAAYGEAVDTLVPVAPETPEEPALFIPDISPMLVVIDPGHGGKDSGALGKDDLGNVLCDEAGNPTFLEKDINLSVARKVYEYLHNGGINVIMTHDTDEFVALRDIADFANNVNATLFVSIHSNSVDGIPTANGTEVLYYDTEQKSMYGITSMELAENIRTEFINVANMTDRGLKERPGLAVLKWTNMPAALIELGFVTNAGDREKLADWTWQDTVAAAIARGIEQALKKLN